MFGAVSLLGGVPVGDEPATTLGIVPQTFLYSYLGRQAPEYVVLFLVTSGFVVAGVVVAVVGHRRERRRLGHGPC